MRAQLSLSLALSVVLVSVPSLADEPTHPLLEDYRSLQEWSFASTPIEVPTEGIHWQTDVAQWHLDRGRVWLQKPTADGLVTGFVFEGSGSFQMTVPDPVELRQLRRFVGEEELDTLEASFEALIARGLGLGPFAEPLQPPQGAGFKPHSLARQRHQHWLALRGFDVDARLVAAMGSTEDAYLRVDMKTKEHGWLTFDYDARRPEEIVVEWFNPSFSVLESWLSLDRATERLATGRPRADPEPIADIQHVDVSADLTRFANESQKGIAKVRPIDARIEVDLFLEPMRDGDQTLQLYLHPWARDLQVRDEQARDLAFIRDHLGKRSSAIDKRIHDDSLIVLLQQPLIRGHRTGLTLSYELELAGFTPGRSWYPSSTYPGTEVHDLHTASLSLSQRGKFAARSMGELLSEDLAEERITTQWQVDTPTKMLSFVFAKQPHEVSVPTAGTTTVAAFSSVGGYVSKQRVRELTEDTAEIVDFFEEIFGRAGKGGNLVVSLIPATHGQAFDGLIHIGDFSTLNDQVAVREMFRAHEVAHLWWGHQVGWHGYRDQWLSEGFAEYSAMMFVESRVENGDEYLQEMLATFTHELTGSIQSTFSQFSRPGFSLLNKRAADRVGPVGHGRRCLVGEAPTAYLSQTYKRGAMTLHSLRTLLKARSGSDEAFLEALRVFIERFGGRYPTTFDFQRVVEEVTEQDWAWFFDAWIYRAEIPTYSWDYSIATSATGVILEILIEQRNVRPDFAMEIPVRLEFGNGSEQVLLAFLDKPTKTFQFPLDTQPKRVILNPDHAVLAKVKKK